MQWAILILPSVYYIRSHHQYIHFYWMTENIKCMAKTIYENLTLCCGRIHEWKFLLLTLRLRFESPFMMCCFKWINQTLNPCHLERRNQILTVLLSITEEFPKCLINQKIQHTSEGNCYRTVSFFFFFLSMHAVNNPHKKSCLCQLNCRLAGWYYLVKALALHTGCCCCCCISRL